MDKLVGFLTASPTGYPNWQILCAALWLGVTAVLKAYKGTKANEPLELVANLLVRVPLVGRVVKPWTTPLVLLLALSASGCAGYTAQQGVACASATLTALANGSDAVLECRRAAKTGTDEQIQQCIEEALISVSKATAAIPACLPPAK